MHYLRSFLPKAGLTWKPDFDVLMERSRDTSALIALKTTVMVSTNTRKETKATMKVVDEVLATLFTTALEPVILQLLTEQHEAFDFFTAVHRSNPLAAKVSEATFVRLFGALVKARKAWKKNPRPPFDVERHSVTAKAVDEFLRQAHNWTGAYVKVYNIVLQDGPDDDDQDFGDIIVRDEDEDEDDEQDEEMGEASMAVDFMEVDNMEMTGEHGEEEEEELGQAETNVEVDNITHGVDEMEIDEY
ncbi:hypothetical protein GGR53DRAFT_462637 [Hypoxylon sp. FL1150]|nr:hypothetical protein GGR53DRAFT_462637 [Hypoxylon sp. FL1150]